MLLKLDLKPTSIITLTDYNPLNLICKLLWAIWLLCSTAQAGQNGLCKKSSILSSRPIVCQITLAQHLDGHKVMRNDNDSQLNYTKICLNCLCIFQETWGTTFRYTHYWGGEFLTSETILLKDHKRKQNKIPVGLSEVHLCLWKTHTKRSEYKVIIHPWPLSLVVIFMWH